MQYERLSIGRLLVCCNLCLCPTGLGPILLSTLSLDYPRPKVIPPYSPLSTELFFVNFVALPKLPSAQETADLLALHVFRLHGIPADIVSDRGPQFFSQVWKAFCSALGATVSLSSGHHSQTNGQAERANQDLESLSLPQTPPPGVLTCLGLSMHITLSPAPPQVCPLLKLLSDTSPLSSRSRRERSLSHRFNTI